MAYHAYLNYSGVASCPRNQPHQTKRKDQQDNPKIEQKIIVNIGFTFGLTGGRIKGKNKVIEK